MAAVIIIPVIRFTRGVLVPADVDIHHIYHFEE